MKPKRRSLARRRGFSFKCQQQLSKWPFPSDPICLGERAKLRVTAVPLVRLRRRLLQLPLCHNHHTATACATADIASPTLSSSPLRRLGSSPPLKLLTLARGTASATCASLASTRTVPPSPSRSRGRTAEGREGRRTPPSSWTSGSPLSNSTRKRG